MLILGVILVVISIIGIVVGALQWQSQYYNTSFASSERVLEQCKPHMKTLGTAAGHECGHLVTDSEGKHTSCRKGKVNTMGNLCVVEKDHIGPGVLLGASLLLIAGIVVCFVKDGGDHVHKHKK